MTINNLHNGDLLFMRDNSEFSKAITAMWESFLMV